MINPSSQKIALIQMTMSPRKADNLARAQQLLFTAAKSGATLACLPELFLTPYFCQREVHANFALAEPLDGESVAAIARAAKELALVIVGSFFEYRARGIYHNTAVVFDAGGEIRGIYRKSHIPDDPGFYEKFYFTPGDTGFKTFSTRAGKIGVIICWDQWFAESARLTALSGADIIFAPTAIGWSPAEKAALGNRQHAAWEIVQRGHAVANGIYFAACNRAGFEAAALSGETAAHADTQKADGIEFWGQSFIADPMGELLAVAPSAGEAVIYAETKAQVIEQTRTAWPFFRDRRIDLYAGMVRRFAD